MREMIREVLEATPRRYNKMAKGSMALSPQIKCRQRAVVLRPSVTVAGGFAARNVRRRRARREEAGDHLTRCQDRAVARESP